MKARRIRVSPLLIFFFFPFLFFLAMHGLYLRLFNTTGAGVGIMCMNRFMRDGI